MTMKDLLKTLWVIYIIEGGPKASVPFGWLRRKKDWQSGKVSFRRIMQEVAKEIRIEWHRWQESEEKKKGWDFAKWLARRGYNANPAEWDNWEKNYRAVANWIEKI